MPAHNAPVPIRRRHAQRGAIAQQIAARKPPERQAPGNIVDAPAEQTFKCFEKLGAFVDAAPLEATLSPLGAF